MSSRASPLVSFVIPAYNYGRFLSECLDSILSQAASVPYEVIVVDDASTDDTAVVLRSYDDPRIRVFRHDRNLGHAATVEEGLRRARGEFVARIDPDDRYRPWFLSETLPRFERSPEVGLVYGDVALIDENGTVTLDRCDRVHQRRDFKGNELVELLGNNFICSASVIARRSAWIDALPVPEGLAFHDWYFTVAIARRYDFCYVDRVVADYRVHPGQHHAAIVKDGSEEPSILRLLDHVYSEPERDERLERRKQRAKRAVYAAQYLTLATKYFGLEMDRDARRCFAKAATRKPTLLLRPRVVRHFAGSLMGRSTYDRLKTAVGVRPR